MIQDVTNLLDRCRELGAKFAPQPDGTLKVQAPAPLPEELRKQLRQHKAEVLAALAPTGEQTDHPHINDRGELIIPFDCDARYHWWKPRGQSVAAILIELNAPPGVWQRYTGAYSESVH